MASNWLDFALQPNQNIASNDNGFRCLLTELQKGKSPSDYRGTFDKTWNTTKQISHDFIKGL